MPAKTPVAQGMDAIMRPITAWLSAQGFRKSARNYNRTAGDGIVQVVNFQMGRHEFRTQQVPGFGPPLYGKFTVELGLYGPCERFLWDNPPGRNIGIGHCSIRIRLGNLLPTGGDAWWTIREPYEKTANGVLEALHEFGLPFFQQFRDYDVLIEHAERTGRLPGVLPGRSALIVALMQSEKGHRDEAVKAFGRARALGPHHGFSEYVSAIESRVFPAGS